MLCCVLFSVSSIAYAATEKVEIESKSLTTTDKNLSVSSVSPTSATSSSGTHTITYGLYARDQSSGQYISGSSMASYTYDYPFEKGLVYPSFNVRDYTWSDYLLCDNFVISRNDGTVMGSKGMTLRLQMNNIGNGMQQGTSSSNFTKVASVTNRYNQVLLRLETPNGSSHYKTFSPSEVLTNSSKYPLDAINLYIEYELPVDVVKVDVEINYSPQYAFPDLNPNINTWIYKTSAFNTNSGYSDIGLYIQTDNAGLLNKVINGISNIKEGVSNLITGITELPSKIWNFIENGLKALFVPTESEMTDIKNQWDTLLSDRFGGLYQTVNLIDDYAKSFTDPEQQNTIKIPELKLPFGQSEFVFGGQDVQIVPDKFSFLIDVIKTIISILATCLFVNGLRNRFERLVGGQE